MKLFLVLSLCAVSTFALTDYKEYDTFLKEILKVPYIRQQLEAKALKSSTRQTGSPGFSCPGGTSAEVPTSVHKLQPGDFNVIGALGDSITAGNGADASGITGLLTEYRGKVFSIGGDGGIDRHVTIANVLRTFNPNLKGYSTGSCSVSNFACSQFNVAIPGGVASGMLAQAEELVERMRNNPDLVNFEDDWKFVNLFIGGNDICNACDPASAQNFIGGVERALEYLHDNLPRTLVNVIPLPRWDALQHVFSSSFICRLVVGRLCSCGLSASQEQLEAVSRAYHAVISTLDDGKYDTKDDFTVIVQHMLTDTSEPPRDGNGNVITDDFAPDCFHLSSKGHGLFARVAWNVLFEPRGQKVTDQDYEDFPLDCPPEDCPFLRTTGNSDNCEL